ncbi:MAG: response regulator [Desulfonatronovibrionaceae bacterium]
MSDRTKVLVVDDEEINRICVQKMLQGKMDLDFAANGEEAIEKYRAHPPDIILLDLVMPRMHGLEVISYLRKNANDSDVYILVATAAGSRKTMVESLNLGANDYVEKPLVREELLARLRVGERQLALLHRFRDTYSRLNAELDLISSLQARLLPDDTTQLPGLDIQTLYIPSGRASGDYFDLFRIKENVLRFVVADVSGHGAGV